MPWCYQEAQRRGLRGDRLAAQVDRNERKVIDALLRGDDAEGVIGRRAGVGVRTLPSSIYTAALLRYGIRTGDDEAGSDRRLPAGLAGADELTERSSGTWHPTLPGAPANFPNEIVRDGARRMLAAALEAEVAADIAAHAGQLDDGGRRPVVRNGHAQTRQVLTSAGAVEVTTPRVNDKRVDEATGERRRFASVILPAWCRKSPKITEVLPLLYLHGLSTKDFVPALEGFLGTGAGLPAATISRLTTQWQHDARVFGGPDLSGVDYVYVWADSIHVNIRLDEEKLCLLVLIGVRVDGRKELIALTDGYWESAGSWADLLRDCARRGMRAPVLAVGDGALGFWGALHEVFPETREQRCWFHKIANVLSALPKSAHPGAKKALAEIWMRRSLRVPDGFTGLDGQPG